MWLAIYSNSIDPYDSFQLMAIDNYKSDAIQSLYEKIQQLPPQSHYYRGTKITRSYLKENASFHRIKIGSVYNYTMNEIMED